MSGKRPPTGGSHYSSEELTKPGDVKSMILIYEGENAIKKIRDVLGRPIPLKRRKVRCAGNSVQA